MASDRTAPADFVTRFAPSPTGLLHLGHAYSAFEAWDAAKAAGGTCVLRIEDTDRSRVRPEFETAIYEDLSWLGLSWPEPVMRQSERHEAYAHALNRLADLGLTYPCRCTRADVRAALAAPQEDTGPVPGTPSVYPGTCRLRPMSEAGPRRQAVSRYRFPRSRQSTSDSPSSAAWQRALRAKSVEPQVRYVVAHGQRSPRSPFADTTNQYI